MNTLLRKSLLFVFVLTLLALAGCASRETTEVAPALENDELALSEQERQAAMTISNGIIYFAYDSFRLTTASEGMLAQKAEVIKQFPRLRVTIEGHCDERGTEEYNLALGERRARAAYDFLVNMGVNAGQLEMVSFGKLHPAVLGHNEAAWSKNRRDEFKVYKPR
jgi:peptidoglycan-associated lipoprotein